MLGEFKKRIKNLEVDENAEKKVLSVLSNAEKSFLFWHVLQSDTCENFNWYKKWFSV